MRPLLAALLAVALLGCDSEKFSWSFVSNPGGGDSFANGGAVLVIRRHSGSGSARSDGALRFLRVTGSDDRGPVTVWLATGSDTALREHGDRVEIRSPLLERPVRLPGAQLALASGPLAFTVAVSDASSLHALAPGAGRLHVAAAGNLLALEHAAGLVLWGTEPAPQTLGLDHSLDLSGSELRLLLPDRRVRLLVPAPPPPIQDRIAFDEQRGSIRIFGPRRERIAELPRGAVTLAGGAQGVFLSAELPDGVSERDRAPLALLMAEHNRHLLRIE
jgi:hypothetical protein